MIDWFFEFEEGTIAPPVILATAALVVIFAVGILLNIAFGLV